MAACADSHNIELTFFHGKGGTVGRGGNPSVYRAIMSHPPNTINGRFRVTEQGEMITQNFGATSIAQRTLDTYTSAVCREAFAKHVEPSPLWRDQMSKISELSCAVYRHMVREEPQFVPYFRQATPGRYYTDIHCLKIVLASDSCFFFIYLFQSWNLVH